MLDSGVRTVSSTTSINWGKNRAEIRLDFPLWTFCVQAGGAKTNVLFLLVDQKVDDVAATIDTTKRRKGRKYQRLNFQVVVVWLVLVGVVGGRGPGFNSPLDPFLDDLNVLKGHSGITLHLPRSRDSSFNMKDWFMPSMSSYADKDADETSKDRWKPLASDVPECVEQGAGVLIKKRFRCDDTILLHKKKMDFTIKGLLCCVSLSSESSWTGANRIVQAQTTYTVRNQKLSIFLACYQRCFWDIPLPLGLAMGLTEGGSAGVHCGGQCDHPTRLKQQGYGVTSTERKKKKLPILQVVESAVQQGVYVCVTFFLTIRVEAPRVHFIGMGAVEGVKACLRTTHPMYFTACLPGCSSSLPFMRFDSNKEEEHYFCALRQDGNNNNFLFQATFHGVYSAQEYRITDHSRRNFLRRVALDDTETPFGSWIHFDNTVYWVISKKKKKTKKTPQRLMANGSRVAQLVVLQAKVRGKGSGINKEQKESTGDQTNHPPKHITERVTLYIPTSLERAKLRNGVTITKQERSTSFKTFLSLKMERPLDAVRADEGEIRLAAHSPNLMDEPTQRLWDLCETTGWRPSAADIRPVVQAGGDVCYQKNCFHHTILQQLIWAGATEAAKVCLETERALDFSRVGRFLTSILHLLCDVEVPDEVTSSMLSAIVHRLETHPGDIMDWSLENWDGNTAVIVAAQSQKLSLYWPIVRRVPYYTNAVQEPIWLLGSNVWWWDWNALGPEEQEHFYLSHAEDCIQADRVTGTLWRLLCRLNAKNGRGEIPVLVASAVRDGANVLFSHTADIILHNFIRNGVFPCVSACLQTEHVLDCTIRDESGMNPLHAVFVGDKTGADTTALLQALLQRLHTQPERTVVDWLQPNGADGKSVFQMAADKMRFGLLWNLLRQHEGCKCIRGSASHEDLARALISREQRGAYGLMHQCAAGSSCVHERISPPLEGDTVVTAHPPSVVQMEEESTERQQLRLNAADWEKLAEKDRELFRQVVELHLDEVFGLVGYYLIIFCTSLKKTKQNNNNNNSEEKKQQGPPPPTPSSLFFFRLCVFPCKRTPPTVSTDRLPIHMVIARLRRCFMFVPGAVELSCGGIVHGVRLLLHIFPFEKVVMSISSDHTSGNHLMYAVVATSSFGDVGPAPFPHPLEMCIRVLRFCKKKTKTMALDPVTPLFYSHLHCSSPSSHTFVFICFIAAPLLRHGHITSKSTMAIVIHHSLENNVLLQRIISSLYSSRRLQQPPPSPEAIRTYVHQGADVMAPLYSNTGPPLLNAFIQHGCVEQVKACLESPLPIDFTAYYEQPQWTPLIAVCHNCLSDDVTRRLLRLIVYRLETHPNDRFRFLHQSFFTKTFLTQFPFFVDTHRGGELVPEQGSATEWMAIAELCKLSWMDAPDPARIRRCICTAFNEGLSMNEILLYDDPVNQLKILHQFLEKGNVAAVRACMFPFEGELSCVGEVPDRDWLDFTVTDYTEGNNALHFLVSGVDKSGKAVSAMLHVLLDRVEARAAHGACEPDLLKSTSEEKYGSTHLAGNSRHVVWEDDNTQRSTSPQSTSYSIPPSSSSLLVFQVLLLRQTEGSPECIAEDLPGPQRPLPAVCGNREATCRALHAFISVPFRSRAQSQCFEHWAHKVFLGKEEGGGIERPLWMGNYSGLLNSQPESAVLAGGRRRDRRTSTCRQPGTTGWQRCADRSLETGCLISGLLAWSVPVLGDTHSIFFRMLEMGNIRLHRPPQYYCTPLSHLRSHRCFMLLLPVVERDRTALDRIPLARSILRIVYPYYPYTGTGAAGVLIVVVSDGLEEARRRIAHQVCLGRFGPAALPFSPRRPSNAYRIQFYCLRVGVCEDADSYFYYYYYYCTLLGIFSSVPLLFIFYAEKKLYLLKIDISRAKEKFYSSLLNFFLFFFGCGCSPEGPSSFRAAPMMSFTAAIQIESSSFVSTKEQYETTTTTEQNKHMSEYGIGAAPPPEPSVQSRHLEAKDDAVLREIRSLRELILTQDERRERDLQSVCKVVDELRQRVEDMNQRLNLLFQHAMSKSASQEKEFQVVSHWIRSASEILQQVIRMQPEHFSPDIMKNYLSAAEENISVMKDTQILLKQIPMNHTKDIDTSILASVEVYKKLMAPEMDAYKKQLEIIGKSLDELSGGQPSTMVNFCQEESTGRLDILSYAATHGRLGLLFNELEIDPHFGDRPSYGIALKEGIIVRDEDWAKLHPRLRSSFSRDVDPVVRRVKATDALVSLMEECSCRLSHDDVPLVRTYVSYGADILVTMDDDDDNNNNNRTVLSHVLRYGPIEAIEELLKTTAPINFSEEEDDLFGWTPLHYISVGWNEDEDEDDITELRSASSRSSFQRRKKSYQDVASILNLVLDRLEAHPEDTASWGCKRFDGSEPISVAALNGFLHVWVKVLIKDRPVPYFLHHTGKILLTESVERSSYNALSKRDRKRFLATAGFWYNNMNRFKSYLVIPYGRRSIISVTVPTRRERIKTTTKQSSEVPNPNPNLNPLFAILCHRKRLTETLSATIGFSHLFFCFCLVISMGEGEHHNTVPGGGAGSAEATRELIRMCEEAFNINNPARCKVPPSLDKIRELICEGADITAKFSSRMPAINFFIYRGYTEHVKAMLQTKRRIDFTVSELPYWTPFHIACHSYLTDEQTKAILQLLVYRAETHPEDITNFFTADIFSKDYNGGDLIPVADTPGDVAVAELCKLSWTGDPPPQRIANLIATALRDGMDLSEIILYDDPVCEMKMLHKLLWEANTKVLRLFLFPFEGGASCVGEFPDRDWLDFTISDMTYGRNALHFLVGNFDNIDEEIEIMLHMLLDRVEARAAHGACEPDELQESLCWWGGYDWIYVAFPNRSYRSPCVGGEGTTGSM
eukprot:gene7692-5394_t